MVSLWTLQLLSKGLSLLCSMCTSLIDQELKLRNADQWWLHTKRIERPCQAQLKVATQKLDWSTQRRSSSHCWYYRVCVSRLHFSWAGVQRYPRRASQAYELHRTTVFDIQVDLSSPWRAVGIIGWICVRRYTTYMLTFVGNTLF